MTASADYEAIITNFLKSQTAEEKNDKKLLGYGITIGVVVDTDDPLQNGRLRIFCPSLNDSPKKLLHIPWCSYSSPFGGSINHSSFTRGNDVGPPTSTGAVHYGFWAIPEQGAHVLVGCIDGDIRRRVWLGCVPENQETHTLPHGRFKWNGSGGTPDGPFTSDEMPLEPLYTNLGKAFNNDRKSREWKTRAADYQATAVDETIGQIPNESKSSYLDEQYGKISEAEEDEWVKPFLGAHGYDWSGLKAAGSFATSRVYSLTTPGFHSFSMDDRHFNCRIRMRTVGGHQIIMDDTNERIYIATQEGNSWIEMDSSGNIDTYSKKRYSVHAEQDINFTSDETIRFWGKKGIHLYSGNNQNQSSLDSPPQDGEIRIQASNDLHLIGENNLRMYSTNDALFEFGGKNCVSIGDSLYLQVQNEINVITNTGDFNVSISGDINEVVNGDTNRFAFGNMFNNCVGDSEVLSFGGKLDAGSLRKTTIKSTSNDVYIEAVGRGSQGGGAVTIKSPESVLSVTSKGINGASNKDVRLKSKTTVNAEIAPGPNDTPQSPPPFSEDQLTECSDTPELPSPCEPSAPLSLDGYSGAELAARAAYNSGFRGDDLVTIVAIAGGESSYNPNAVGDEHLTSEKWGPSLGFWQVRSLNDYNPNAGYLPDRFRDASQLTDPQFNADAAYAIYTTANDRNPEKRFDDWSVYTSGKHADTLCNAKAAVYNLCTGAPPSSMSNPEAEFRYAFTIPSLPNASDLSSIIDSFNPLNAISSKTMFKLTATNIDMQAITDISMKSITNALSTNMFSGLISQFNAVIGGITSMAGVIEDAIGALSGSLTIDLSSFIPLPDLGLDMLTDLIPELPFSHFSETAQNILNLNVETVISNSIPDLP